MQVFRCQKLRSKLEGLLKVCGAARKATVRRLGQICLTFRSELHDAKAAEIQATDLHQVKGMRRSTPDNISKSYDH